MTHHQTHVTEDLHLAHQVHIMNFVEASTKLHVYHVHLVHTQIIKLVLCAVLNVLHASIAGKGVLLVHFVMKVFILKAQVLVMKTSLVTI